MDFAVYWLISMQRFRRYLNNSSLKNQLYYCCNAWLRLTGIAALTYAAIAGKTPKCPLSETWSFAFAYGVAVNLFYAIFMIVWDLVISYGVLRCWTYPKWGLREKLYFPVWTYYLMIFYCMLARLSFLIGLVIFEKCSYNLTGNAIYLSTILYAIDIGRRFIWCILRTECEMVNNYEGFRSINEIPEVNEDADDPAMDQLKYTNLVKDVLNKIDKGKSADSTSTDKGQLVA
jgi:hypothetical protein